MTADARNTVNLIGGLVDNPEIIAGGKVAKMRLAVDYAGNDATDKDNRTGYFTLKMFANDSAVSKFVFDQITSEKMKKGSQIAIVGRLEHSRYEVDGNKRSEVQVVIESLTYVGGGIPKTAEGTAQVAQAITPPTGDTNVPNW